MPSYLVGERCVRAQAHERPEVDPGDVLPEDAHWDGKVERDAMREGPEPDAIGPERGQLLPDSEAGVRTLGERRVRSLRVQTYQPYSSLWTRSNY